MSDVSPIISKYRSTEPPQNKPDLAELFQTHINNENYGIIRSLLSRFIEINRVVASNIYTLATKKHVPVDIIDSMIVPVFGKNPLLKFIVLGDVEKILQSEIDESNNFNLPLMTIAGGLGNQKVIEALRQRGLPFNRKEELSPLSLASESGHKKLVTWLLLEGVRVSKADFLYAAKIGDIKLMEKFLNSWGDINTGDNGISVVHMAAMGGQIDVLQFLKKEGAFMMIKASNGKTPLDYATEDAKTWFKNNVS